MNINFKTSTSLDIDSIYQLSKNLIDEYEDITNINYDYVLKWVYKKIGENIHEYTSIYLDNVLVGYYRFHEEDGMMELDDLYIFESYQNKGIGSYVLNKCILETDKKIYLYVFIKNVNAIRFYERFGFKILEKINNTRYIMVK